MAKVPRVFSFLTLGTAGALALTSCAALPGGMDKPEPGNAGGGGGGVEIIGDISRDEVLAGLSDEDEAYLIDAGDTKWDVTYKSDAQILSGQELDALVSADQGSGEYIFDAAAVQNADITLREGEVLLLAGHSLVRVIGVAESGDKVTVATEPASLDELIHDGTVAWDVPVSFDFEQFFTSVEPSRDDAALSMNTVDLSSTPQITAIGMEMPDGSIVSTDDDQSIVEAIFDSISIDRENNSVEWEFSSGNNKYQFRLIANGDSVEVVILVTRTEDNDAQMAYRAEGTIGTVRSVAEANYADGELQDSDVNLDNFAIDLDLSVAAAGGGIASLRREIPVPFMKYTWLVGPVPITLEIKASITGAIKAELDASATAKASFAYRGGAGVSFEGTSLSTAGKTDLAEMDPEPADAAASMGVNVDAQYGVAFPEVSLSMLGQGLVPYVRPGFVMGTSLTWGGPAAGFPASSLCKEAYVRTEVEIGYDFKVLGTSLKSHKEKLYEDKRETQSENCPSGEDKTST